MPLAILESRGDTPARTKEVCSEYKRVADAIGTTQLTSQSIRDKLTNLDTYNLAMTRKRQGGYMAGIIIPLS